MSHRPNSTSKEDEQIGIGDRPVRHAGTGNDAAAEKQRKGAVYTPYAGVICDKKAGFCADSEGISAGFTKEYLGQAAQDNMMKRINEASAGNYDTTWFTVSNGVSCKTKEKACTARKLDGALRKK